MYLADKVVHCATPLTIELHDREWRLPGTVVFTEQVSECAVRYVLQSDVHEACCQLAERWSDLLDPANPKLRVPMERIWTEWRDPETNEQVGVLVNATPDGRAGTMRFFWTQDGIVEVAQAEILFDFDRRVDFTQSCGRPYYGLRALPDAFAGLKRHLALTLDRAWQIYFGATALGPHGLAEASSMCGERLWPDVVRALSFFVLVASRTPFVERPMQRARLNAVRAKAGKAPLLDHVEIRIGQTISQDCEHSC